MINTQKYPLNTHTENEKGIKTCYYKKVNKTQKKTSKADNESRKAIRPT